jgi:hypothetical protein
VGSTDGADDLPVRARDALVGLLVAGLARKGGERDLAHAVEVALLPAGAEVGLTSVEAANALERAGLIAQRHPDGGSAYVRVRPDWDEPAVRRLYAYRDVLTQAPRGQELAVRLEQARALLGKELFFEVHELLEPTWQRASGEARQLLQGLIQASVAWYHWGRGNQHGARVLASAAAEKLRGGPGDWLGFPLADVRRAVDGWSSWWSSGAIGRPPELPFAGTSAAPKLRR